MARSLLQMAGIFDQPMAASPCAMTCDDLSCRGDAAVGPAPRAVIHLTPSFVVPRATSFDFIQVLLATAYAKHADCASPGNPPYVFCIADQITRGRGLDRVFFVGGFIDEPSLVRSCE